MRRATLTLVGFGWLLSGGAACSGQTVDGQNAAGSAGNVGGAAGSAGAAGIGGAPVPPASQGAASITFATADAPIVAMCPVPHRATAPIPIAGSTTTTNASKGTEAIDGQNGSLVTCAVTLVAGGYAVNALIHSEIGAAFADIAISNLTIAQGQSDARGTLSVLDDTTQYAYSSPTTIPCTFSVVGSSLGIGPGKIWASVTCPSLIDRGSANSDQCKATGYFIFENCAQ
jgi:hypothetical protein